MSTVRLAVNASTATAATDENAITTEPTLRKTSNVFSRSFDRHRPTADVAAAHGHEERADPRGGVIAQIREH